LFHFRDLRDSFLANLFFVVSWSSRIIEILFLKKCP
jgi:hypothetical protein